MAEITSYAYGDLREYMKNTYKAVAIANATAEVKRYTNVDITVEGGKVKYKVLADNTDGSLTGKKVDRFKIYKTGTSTDVIAEVTFAVFTYENNNDTLTIEIELIIPSV
ncbi:hypothetical protein [Lysinibacillus sp. NPDC093216]|uniref:hypothetical protein n=1 Tax=Lysinibacillus sp. NPDC093216 TaxID=3390576 RepID=UPI003D0623CD